MSSPLNKYQHWISQVDRHKMSGTGASPPPPISTHSRQFASPILRSLASQRFHMSTADNMSQASIPTPNVPNNTDRTRRGDAAHWRYGGYTAPANMAMRDTGSQRIPNVTPRLSGAGVPLGVAEDNLNEVELSQLTMSESLSSGARNINLPEKIGPPSPFHPQDINGPRRENLHISDLGGSSSQSVVSRCSSRNYPGGHAQVKYFPNSIGRKEGEYKSMGLTGAPRYYDRRTQLKSKLFPWIGKGSSDEDNQKHDESNPSREDASGTNSTSKSQGPERASPESLADDNGNDNEEGHQSISVQLDGTIELHQSIKHWSEEMTSKRLEMEKLFESMKELNARSLEANQACQKTTEANVARCIKAMETAESSATKCLDVRDVVQLSVSKCMEGREAVETCVAKGIEDVNAAKESAVSAVAATASENTTAMIAKAQNVVDVSNLDITKNWTGLLNKIIPMLEDPVKVMVDSFLKLRPVLATAVVAQSQPTAPPEDSAAVNAVSTGKDDLPLATPSTCCKLSGHASDAKPPAETATTSHSPPNRNDEPTPKRKRYRAAVSPKKDTIPSAPTRRSKRLREQVSARAAKPAVESKVMFRHTTKKCTELERDSSSTLENKRSRKEHSESIVRDLSKEMAKVMSSSPTEPVSAPSSSTAPNQHEKASETPEVARVTQLSVENVMKDPLVAEGATEPDAVGSSISPLKTGRKIKQDAPSILPKAKRESIKVKDRFDYPKKKEMSPTNDGTGEWPIIRKASKKRSSTGSHGIPRARPKLLSAGVPREIIISAQVREPSPLRDFQNENSVLPTPKSEAPKKRQLVSARKRTPLLMKRRKNKKQVPNLKRTNDDGDGDDDEFSF